MERKIQVKRDIVRVLRNVVDFAVDWIEITQSGRAGGRNDQRDDRKVV